MTNGWGLTPWHLTETSRGSESSPHTLEGLGWKLYFFSIKGSCMILEYHFISLQESNACDWRKTIETGRIQALAWPLWLHPPRHPFDCVLCFTAAQSRGHLFLPCLRTPLCKVRPELSRIICSLLLLWAKHPPQLCLKILPSKKKAKTEFYIKNSHEHLKNILSSKSLTGQSNTSLSWFPRPRDTFEGIQKRECRFWAKSPSFSWIYTYSSVTHI